MQSHESRQPDGSRSWVCDQVYFKLSRSNAFEIIALKAHGHGLLNEIDGKHEFALSFSTEENAFQSI
jgi:hypothetical protein